MDKTSKEEAVECPASENPDELAANVVVIESRGNDKENEKQVDELSRTLQEQASSSNDLKEPENVHELSAIITDVYSLSSDKFEPDIIHFIEPGQALENWQHHGYSQSETDSFSHSSQNDMDSEETCISELHSGKICQDSVTLTVLNSTSTDEIANQMTFSFTQPTTQVDTSLIDHDYCVRYSRKEDYPSPITCFQENTTTPDEQNDSMGMDQEKLQRMKRRKEKNRECSRQFRLKQKDKEQRLTLGKIEKSKTLDTMKRNVEKLKAILSKISQKCASCPKTAMLLNQYVTGDKENINPNIAQDVFK